MIDVDMTITGLQQAQRAQLRRVAALRPDGALGRGVKYATLQLHRYAVAITHVDTGALRASHTPEIDDSLTRGRIFINPSAQNPRTGALTSRYGPVEEKRGGDHAYYRRTVEEAGVQALQEGAEIIAEGLR